MLLDLPHAVPLAGVLGSFFAGAPTDLAIVFGGHAKELPPAPAGSAVALWVAWLGECSEQQLATVLDALAPLDWQKVEAARAYRARAVAVASGSLGALPLVAVDRRRLVESLGDMVGGALRILRVDGERGAGKTFTSRIVRHFLGSCGQTEYAFVEADCAAYSLAALAAWLLRCLRGDEVALPAEGDTTRVRWIEQLAEVVVQEATSRPERTAWLALDRCSLGTPTGGAPELGVFLRRLAEVVEDHAMSPAGPRLILLECPSALTARRRRTLVEEQLAPVVRADIEEFLGARAFDPERAAVLASEIEAAMRAPGAAYPLELMNERLSSLVEEASARG